MNLPLTLTSSFQNLFSSLLKLRANKLERLPLASLLSLVEYVRIILGACPRGVGSWPFPGMPSKPALISAGKAKSLT
jgi:hypothetical protein